MDYREPWLERHPILGLIGGLVGLGAVVGLVWGVNVALSPVKGTGDAYQQKNSVQNWTSAQRGFHQEFNDVTAYQAKIATAKQSLQDFQHNHTTAEPSTPYDPIAQQENNLQTTVTGLQQQCINTVSQYNTDAQSYLTEDWRDAGLPSQLTPGMCQ